MQVWEDPEEPIERREEYCQGQSWGAMLNVPGNHFSALLTQSTLPLAPPGKPFHTFTLSQIVPCTSFSSIINSVLRIIFMTIHSFFTRTICLCITLESWEQTALLQTRIPTAYEAGKKSLRFSSTYSLSWPWNLLRSHPLMPSLPLSWPIIFCDPLLSLLHQIFGKQRNTVDVTVKNTIIFFFFLLFSNKQIDCCQHISFFIIGHFQWVCHCIFFHSAALLLRLVLDNLSAKIIMSTGIFLFQQGKKRQVNLLQEVHKLENIL